MSVQLTNTTFELRITPNKRKRDDLKERKQYNYGSNSSNKENHFVYNNFMEVKSIAELVESKNACNPFEIVRKPPKKKNRKEYEDDGCFVNPALNLNGPEHVVNPFEIKRTASLPEAVHHCYENTGLNIRGEERQVINPFEIVRECTSSSNTAAAAVAETANGIENPGLDIRQGPLAISVPFTPTVGCRIDFKNVPIENLTPSSMLNHHLVFSPVTTNEATPKRKNLSVISEEAVDISKELDCYQLELENSMNEARMNKRGKKNLMDIKQKSAFAKRLSSSAAINDVPLKISEEVVTPKEEHLCCDSSNGHSDCPKSSTPKTPNENCIAKYSLDKSISINENPDVVYEEVNESHHNELFTEKKKLQDEEEEEEEEEENFEKLAYIRNEENVELFKNPAPFVRAYRRDLRKRPTFTTNEPTTETNNKLQEQIKTEDKQKEINEVFNGIRSSIRKSIRKLIHPSSSNKSKNADEVTPTKEPQFPNSNILTTIRHSLRRKQPKQPLATSTPRQSLNNISIIDAEPRAVYKDTAFSARINNPIDKDFLRPRTNLRNSLRRSKHAVKNVFKKSTEDYEFRK